jgi:PleD family two-component response regulator
VIENINNLVAVNNQFYSGLPLSLSLGAATSRPGERLETTAKRADLKMLEAKRAHYEAAAHDRRLRAAIAS